MPRRQRIEVTPDEFVNYRPVPGFSKKDRFPDQPDGSYSIASKGRSARRYYNPALPVTDPRREIGDNTYFRLAKKQDALTQERARQRLAQFHERQARNTRSDIENAERAGLTVPQFKNVRRELAVQDYIAGPFQQDRSPDGYMARLLENLGWRPPGAPWRVGASGSDRALPQLAGKGDTPAAVMGRWRAGELNTFQGQPVWLSQSSIRGRIA